jgi:hypothetical protein
VIAQPSATAILRKNHAQLKCIFILVSVTNIYRFPFCTLPVAISKENAKIPP